MGVLINSLIGGLLMPPGILLALLLVALGLAWRRPRAARALLAVVCLGLYVLSTPYASSHLLQLLEPQPADPLGDRTGQAIVVIGAGTYRAAPEYGRDTVNALALVRLRYAAHIYRALKAPVLVSGGTPAGDYTPEAHSMKQVLEDEFHVPVAWVEDASGTTLENARRSYRMLSAGAVKRIYLVTHAWHMPRARYAFESAGFEVIVAPTSYSTLPSPDMRDFVPGAQALVHSAWFFHEVIGIGWYYLRVAIGR